MPNDVPQVDVSEAKRRIDEGATLVDVREVGEYEEVHIPGAQLLPMSQFVERWEELPQDQELAVYCRSGGRSAMAVKALNERGYRAVNVEGGIDSWQEQGYPTESGDE